VRTLLTSLLLLRRSIVLYIVTHHRMFLRVNSSSASCGISNNYDATETDQVEEVLAKEQTGIGAGRGTVI